MTDAPERIWRVEAYIPSHNTEHGLASWADKERAGSGSTEYVRADIVTELVEVLEQIAGRSMDEGGCFYKNRASIREARGALAKMSSEQ